MEQDRKDLPLPDQKERQQRAEERSSLTAKIQFLEKQLAEKNQRNEKLLEASNDLSLANKSLAQANSDLAKANLDLTEANEKLIDANLKLTETQNSSPKNEPK